MLRRLREKRFTVQLTAVVLFAGASAGLYFAPGHGPWPQILLGATVLGATLSLLV